MPLLLMGNIRKSWKMAKRTEYLTALNVLDPAFGLCCDSSNLIALKLKIRVGYL